MTTHYLLDGGNVIGEVEGDESYTYVRGVNLIFGRARYYLYNAHGDVVQLTNTNGELTKNYNYDAFGNERSPSEEDTNPFRYCGEYYDTETGLYYLRARYYNPLIGRFTQSDSVRYVYRDLPNGTSAIDPLSLNLYTYCANNPIVYCDPTGHFWDIVFDVVGAFWSLYDLLKDPSWTNLAFLAWDVGAMLVPFIPGSYAGKGVRALGRVDDVVDATHGIGKLDDVIDVAKYADEIADSRLLRKNMIASGVKEPWYKHAAHHIVAGNSKHAVEAREILAKFGISINDAANGVFLPTVRGASSAAYHPSLHTKAYYRKVNELLSTATTREEAVRILEMIAEQLLNGEF